MQLVIAALLECGYPWPSAKYFRTYEYWGSTAMASVIMVQRCMEKQGFSSHYGSRYFCSQGLAEQFRQYKTLEQLKAIEHACDINTPPPEPSVEKRLSSPYCKTEWASKFSECQPVVVPSVKKWCRALIGVCLGNASVIQYLEWIFPWKAKWNIRCILR